MSPSVDRLRRIGICYALGLALVLVQLAVVMLWQHEDWLVRSYRNRWAFREVPSVRGALLDRHDRVLAHDRPAFELRCIYERFRVLHPVGAVIHAATAYSAVQHGVETRYSFEPGPLGPELAIAELLAMPVGVLLDGSLPGTVRRELLQSAIVVLAAASGRSHGRVRKELLLGARSAPGSPLGAALSDLSPDQVAMQLRSVLARLHAIDAATGAAQGAAGPAPRSLLSWLDEFRRDSLAGRRTRGDEGELMERLSRPVLRSVPFDLAAALRLAAADQPGLRLEPALDRVRVDTGSPTLEAILGGVVDLDRLPSREETETYLSQRLEEDLAPGLGELVPEDLSPSPEFVAALREEAKASYRRVMLQRERRGRGGLEAALDNHLGGVPGLRLVEHDARAREQRLWSSLRVAAGSDVALTVDLDLQRSLETAVAAAAAEWRRRADADRAGFIDAACAVIDCSSGDVLALCSAPDEVDGERRLPAVLAWRGNGAVGSLVKPLFLLEQMIAAREQRPHKPAGQFFACAGAYPRRIGGRLLRCDHAHHAEGLDPVAAVAKSCNTFFFQVAEGLGPAGLRRACTRFGLLPPDAGEGDGRHLGIVDLPAAMVAAPVFDDHTLLPLRGIGYGLAANPLALARAYAALATGLLPTPGFVRGEQRPRHALGALPEEIGVVRQGLAGCVEYGTARGLPELRQFGVVGKTGTAEVGLRGVTVNNAWFAGYLPPAADGVQLSICAVIYAVPDRVHGADAAGAMLARWLEQLQRDPVLSARYLPQEVRR